MEIKKTRLYVEGMAVDVFYRRSTDFSVNKRAAVLLPGFPDFIGPNTLTYIMLSEDIVVFQPHLIGTFDSAGEFSPNSVKQSMLFLNSLIWEARGSKMPNGPMQLLPWNIKSLILCGHSFSGILVLRYFPFLYHLDKILLTSPALHYAEKYGCNEDGLAHYEGVRKAYPYTYRLAPSNSWNGILEGIDNLPEMTIGEISEVLCLYGSNDRYFDVPLASRLVPDLINAYIRTGTNRIEIINEAGHPLVELLEKDETKELILDFIKR